MRRPSEYQHHHHHHLQEQQPQPQQRQHRTTAAKTAKKPTTSFLLYVAGTFLFALCTAAFCWLAESRGMPRGRGRRHLGDDETITVPQETGFKTFVSGDDECAVFYRLVEATGGDSKGDILWLHGASFDSSTWLKTKSLAAVAAAGYTSIAVDLPGYGQSALDKAENKGCKKNAKTLLADLVVAFKLTKPVVVTPSMSGRFALTMYANTPAVARGYVMVAPVIPEPWDVSSASSSRFPPALVIWGSEDVGGKERSESRLSKLPRATTFEVAGGSHPCYLDAPQVFNEKVVEFLRSL